MAKIKIGRVRPVYRGDYSTSTAYVVLDRVKHNGSIWECIADATGIEPQASASTYWIEIGARGDTGAAGKDGLNGQKGEPGTPGRDGTNGQSAKITNVTATVSDTVGTPSVKVTLGGTDLQRTIDLAFSGLKGQTGAAGATQDVSGLVQKSGNRGSLSGYEAMSSSYSVTVTSTSADDQVAEGTITVQNGTSGQTWQKNVAITSVGAKVSPGSNWKWAGGSAPEVKANSLLVCKWCGTFGILSLITTE